MSQGSCVMHTRRFLAWLLLAWIQTRQRSAELQQRDCTKIWKNKVWQKISHVSVRATHWHQSRMLQQSPDIQPVSGSTYKWYQKLLITPSPWAHSHRLFDKAYLKRMCNIFGFKMQHVCDSLAVWSLFRWRSSKASPALSKTLEATAEELRCRYLPCQRSASPPEGFLWWVYLQ